MAYTTQKTVTAMSPSADETIQSGRIDPSLQAHPQREVLERDTARYAPPTRLALAPNVDDDVNPGIEIEEWSDL